MTDAAKATTEGKMEIQFEAVKVRVGAISEEWVMYNQGEKIALY